MSAKNGVYILASRGPKTRHGYKKEYRVIHAKDIEDITWCPDYPTGNGEVAQLNREDVLRYFGAERVFTDRRIAEGYAQRIYDENVEDYGAVEYGICFLDYAHIPFPKKSGERRGGRSRASVS